MPVIERSALSTAAVTAGSFFIRFNAGF
jgi:hypothetical protein